MESLKTVTFEASMDGDYVICFYNVDQADKRLSFDFSENIVTQVIATEDHMKAVERDLQKANDKIYEVETNLNFQHERDEDHYEGISFKI